MAMFTLLTWTSRVTYYGYHQVTWPTYFGYTYYDLVEEVGLGEHG